MKMTAILLTAAALAATPLSADAERFEKVTDASRFVSLVEGRDLTRFGIRLNVLKTGQIIGRAFGRDVTGKWEWSNGYFCRDLFFGARDLGPNCQAVLVNGETLRFISDRGAGQFADLELR